MVQRKPNTHTWVTGYIMCYKWVRMSITFFTYASFNYVPGNETTQTHGVDSHADTECTYGVLNHSINFSITNSSDNISTVEVIHNQ